MKYFMVCRRTFIAVFAISCLTGLALANGFDPSMAIASVAIGLAGANAAEKAMQARAEKRYTTEG